MQVQWLGGPHDGHRFDMPNGAKYVMVNREMVPPQRLPDAFVDAIPESRPVPPFTVPITRRIDGVFIAVWSDREPSQSSEHFNEGDK